MKALTRVGLFVKSDLDHCDEAVNIVLKELLDAECDITADDITKKFLPKGLKIQPWDPSSLDLLLVIGGDGTILRAIRECAPTCPVLSVNRGLVGFLTEMTLDEVPTLLSDFLKGKGILEERVMLSVEARRGKDVIFEGEVLNEAVIAQGSIARLVDLRAEVNGEELTTFRSDGLIISTPTGSTAYSLAAGGPVVHPKLSAIILTPINPQSFSQKPIVLPGDAEVLVEVLPKEKQHEAAQVSLTLDGQRYEKLHRGDLVRVRTSKRSITFLRRKHETFLQTLRTKLRWGDRV